MGAVRTPKRMMNRKLDGGKRKLGKQWLGDTMDDLRRLKNGCIRGISKSKRMEG